MRIILIASCLAFLGLAACGDDGGAVDPTGDGGVDPTGDGGVDPTGDAGPTDNDAGLVFTDGGPVIVECDADGPECCNGIDDDEDGDIDGDDIECISPIDDDESSFATGIPGDNKDAKNQDCFFDGDSGAGNDGCNLDTCCILDSCEPKDPADCAVTPECKANCGGITPPGCDCFGCCTICNDVDCYDIVIGDKCTDEVLDDPMKCARCTKLSDECGPADCSTDPDPCVICPGETLPQECQGQVCPGDQIACDVSPCPAGQYCSQGCCLEGVIVQ